MADYFDNGLAAAIKSLEDVVAQAVDPDDPLAREQLQLTIDYLRFVRSRLPYVAAQQLRDLDHYLSMATRVLSVAADVPRLDVLAGEIEAARHVRDTPNPASHLVQTAAERLAGALAHTVDSLDGAPEATRRAVEAAVLDESEHRAAFERSWYLPLSVDPEAPSLPDFESFFVDGSAVR